ncbi:hypothetical protein P9112_002535 [Eukaryota sp. TZLM1-RC]
MSNNDVLAQIRAFKKGGLKKTETVDKSVPPSILKAQQQAATPCTNSGSSAPPPSLPTPSSGGGDLMSELQAQFSRRNKSNPPPKAPTPPAPPQKPVSAPTPPAPPQKPVSAPTPPAPPQKPVSAPTPPAAPFVPPPPPKVQPPPMPPKPSPAPKTKPSPSNSAPVETNKKKAPPPVPPKASKPRNTTLKAHEPVLESDYYRNRISPFAFAFKGEVPSTTLPFRNCEKNYPIAGTCTEWNPLPIPDSHLSKLVSRIKEKREYLNFLENQLDYYSGRELPLEPKLIGYVEEAVKNVGEVSL